MEARDKEEEEEEPGAAPPIIDRPLRQEADLAARPGREGGKKKNVAMNEEFGDIIDCKNRLWLGLSV